MRAWWHWVLVILGTIVAVVLLAAGGLAYLVYRLDIKGEIEHAFENATGRDLTINGDVGVSYWPVLGFHAGNDVLANVPGGRAPAFITADDIHIGVELTPLLNRQVVVRELVMQHPRVALEVDANGRPNWALAPRARGLTAPVAPGAPQSPPVIDASRTTLRSIDIAGGEVTYFDARHGTGWSVGDVDLHTAITALNQPMNVVGSVRYNDRPVQLDINVNSPNAIIRAQATPVQVNLRSDLVTAAFEGQTPAASSATSGTVHAYGASLRQLLAWLGAPLQGGAGFEHFDVTGHVAIGGGQFAFDDAGFVLDQLSGRGDFSLSSLRGKPYLSGRLELFDFDLNPYISGHTPSQQAAPSPPAPAAPATSAPEQAPQAPTSQIVVVQPPDRVIDIATPPGATPIDFSGLHAFNADLELVTHAVLISHARLDSARATLVLNDGYLAATMQSMTLYGGSGRGRFEIDARAPDARFVQAMTFDNLNAQPFLTDAINYSGIEGRAELAINLSSHGGNQREIVRNAKGRTHLELVSGTLHGVDLGGVSRTIRNALRGELIAPEARTQFQGFSANLAIANGSLGSDDLSFNTPDLRTPGIGVLDLMNRRLDLRIAPRSPRGGLVIPFSIRGPLNQLRYTSDIGGSALRELQPHVRAVQTASR
ncbi:MAG: AsmA family protein [Proteobacteria bacterium]|nr:AsmA family protein [Pseudomonadota bacterium]